MMEIIVYKIIITRTSPAVISGRSNSSTIAVTTTTVVVVVEISPFSLGGLRPSDNLT